MNIWGPVMNIDNIKDLLHRRQVACETLAKSLSHLPLAEVLDIVTSFMPLDALEDCATLQLQHSEGLYDAGLLEE